MRCPAALALLRFLQGRDQDGVRGGGRQGERPLRQSCSSDQQRRFYDGARPEGIELDDLTPSSDRSTC